MTALVRSVAATRSNQAEDGALQLSIVIPTFNERANIDPLLDGLGAALAGAAWEVIFVDDDSPDGTAEHIRSRAQRDRQIRCLKRIDRRGLSSACIEGILASSAPFVAVMDADLQHDEAMLPRMLEILQSRAADVVVGSRYIAGGSGTSLSPWRRFMSRAAAGAGRTILKAELSDPASGYFMLRREVFDAVVGRLTGVGWKILIDILAASERPLAVHELPYEFRERRHGESKLDALVIYEYFVLLADKLIGRFVPVRLVLFAMVGATGLAVHLVSLKAVLLATTLGFDWAQAVATGVAMVSNFFLNNWLTYSDRRLRGWAMLRGLGSFALVCSIGAVASVAVADQLFERTGSWWIAGLAGASVGALWNFALTSLFTWNARRH
ncbi:MAG: glycosyltransferase family 2 protein [Proteobacteria bacterium]|nr:glycosyltransferase family 2 protein [Pseudomonadota bacterium]MBI3495799.1 glycosyltransferase family 2 protein [Pseudomonadota bacterium]